MKVLFAFLACMVYTTAVAKATIPVLSPITHVVIIFQENRTPDQLLQDGSCTSPDASQSDCLSGFNFSSVGMVGKHQVALVPIDLCSNGGTCHCHVTCSNPQNYDVNHSHKAWLNEYNGGLMNGWDVVSAPCGNFTPHCAMTYTPYGQIEPYITMASSYATSDNFFADQQGPSFPGHQYIISGSSKCGTLCTASKTVAGACCLNHPTPPPTTASLSNLFAVNNPGGGSGCGPGGCGGCDSSSSVLVDAMDPYGVLYPNALFTCFDRTTVADLATNAGLTWQYYQSGSGSGIWFGYDSIWHIWNNPNYASSSWIDTNPADVITNVCTNHTLANVTWVTPTALASDHATVTDGSGPDWVASVVNAIGGSTGGCDGRFWNSTAIFVTWDDWGGWYDHVAPYMFSDYEKGFRVPLIAISAYTPSGTVDHSFGSFGSILKFTEEALGLGSLGGTDVNAYDLSGMFNFGMTARTFNAISVHLTPHYFASLKPDNKEPDY